MSSAAGTHSQEKVGLSGACGARAVQHTALTTDHGALVFMLSRSKHQIKPLSTKRL